ncbi:MAG: hypothetical protein K8R74_13110 [Bacteroidales bacterium]|nr:hypothetical protein [Bacteroidales bacterium]
MFGINKKKFFRAVAFMVIVVTYLPIVYNNLPQYIGSYHLFAAIWLGSVLVFYPRLIVEKSFLFLLFFGLVFVILLLNTLWSEMTDWNKSAIQREFYFFSVAISVILYFKMERDYEGLARLVKWALIFIGITAIMSIYSTSINPMAGRYMTDPSVFESGEFEQFKKLGVGSHVLSTILVALFPIMFYYYRNRTDSIFSRKLIIFYGIISFIAIIRIQVFANILLSVFIIIVSLAGRKRIKESILTISILIIVFIIIPASFYAGLLMNISSYFDPDSVVYYKLKDMAQFVTARSYYGTGAGGRASRYPLLFEAFIENPLLGYFAGDHTRDIAAGGHLYWMNRLTIFGLLGFIPLLIIHVGYIKSAIKFFNEEFTFYFLVSVFAILGLGLMKNLAGQEMWFAYFVLLPGLYFLPLLKKKKRKFKGS